MTPLARNNVTLVQEGERVTIPTGWPVQPKEHVVKPGCVDPQFRTSGQWVCVTHGLVHSNNLQADLHEREEGEHRIAWTCWEHGVEVPQT